MSTIFENTPELSITPLKIVKTSCLTSNLSNTCINLNKSQILSVNNSNLCRVCDLYELKIDTKVQYFDLVKQGQLTVYLQPSKINEKFDIFSIKVLNINMSSSNQIYDIMHIISNSPILPTIKFKLIDSDNSLAYNLQNFTLSLKLLSSLTNKKVRLYLTAYINDIYQDECLIKSSKRFHFSTNHTHRLILIAKAAL